MKMQSMCRGTFRYIRMSKEYRIGRNRERHGLPFSGFPNPIVIPLRKKYRKPTNR